MTDEELNRRFEEMNRRFDQMREEMREFMRDMQTEMLRGLERFSRGNFSRLHRLETSDNDINERVNALEERVLALETRPPNKL